MKKNKLLETFGFDMSDTPDERGRMSPPPVPTGKPTIRHPARPGAQKMNPTSHLPGLPPEHAADEIELDLDDEITDSKDFDLSDTPDHRGRPSPPPRPTGKSAVVRSPGSPIRREKLPGVHEADAPGSTRKRSAQTVQAPIGTTPRNDSATKAALGTPIPHPMSNVAQQPLGTPIAPQPASKSEPTFSQRTQAPTAPIPLGNAPVLPQAGAQAGAPPGARSKSATTPLTPQGMDPNAPQSDFDVEIPGVGTYRVKADSPERASLALQASLNSGDDQGISRGAAGSLDHNRFNAKPAKKESTSAGSIGAGPQRKLGTEGIEILRHLVNSRIQEIVRKKKGGGGYSLYPPNKGKKNKNQKSVGDFPTRFAAKQAELARFPPKDPGQLQRAREKLNKLAKDPKRRREKERQELTGVKSAPKKTKKPNKPMKAKKDVKKEQIVSRMTRDLSERLFKEDEILGSPWDERISSFDQDTVSSDKKLHKYLKGIEDASQGALGDSHKTLAKVLRGMAKVNPGDVMRDPERNKMYMPISLDLDGNEIGPIHLYVDGGNVCIEISPEARDMITELEPSMAKNLRGGLMSFQEDHLPKISRAKDAWTTRDSYLDSLHKKLEKSVGGLSPVELALIKQMMDK